MIEVEGSSPMIEVADRSLGLPRVLRIGKRRQKIPSRALLQSRWVIERLLVKLGHGRALVQGALHVEPGENAGVGSEAELVVHALDELELRHGAVAGERVGAEKVALQLALVPTAVAAVGERPALRAVQVVTDWELAQLDDVGDAGGGEGVLREI